jgi:hypothetical protein
MTALGDFSPGDVLTAADLNAIGEWTAFTPVWTASGTTPSLGNGSIYGRYVQINKLVIAQIGIVFGSTTTQGSGAWRIDYPVTPNRNDLFVAGDLGSGRMYDGAGNTDNMHVMSQATDSYFQLLTDTAGVVGAGVPWTWNSGDECLFTMTYRAA